MRLLLLARAAGDWWTRLGDLGGPVGDVVELPTLDDTPADRDNAFHAAVHGFATRLARLSPAEPAVD